MLDQIRYWLTRGQLTMGESAILQFVANCEPLLSIRDALQSQLLQIRVYERDIQPTGYIASFSFSGQCRRFAPSMARELVVLETNYRDAATQITVFSDSGLLSQISITSLVPIKPWAFTLAGITVLKHASLVTTPIVLRGWVKQYVDCGWLVDLVPPGDLSCCVLDRDEIEKLPAEYLELLSQSDGALIADGMDTAVLGIRDLQIMEFAAHRFVPLIDQREVGAIGINLPAGQLVKFGGIYGDGYPMHGGFKDVIRDMAANAT